ncbi:hypothetical protein HYV73_04870 [Candidatus Uhrbacteria bacterium]|nr:hypothetical protein [Candidatus Uhrbacteria bacterium]
MEKILRSASSPGAVQVIGIGNAYDAMDPVVPEKMEPLFLADHIHLSQKALYWQTPYGQPSVVLCRGPVRQDLLETAARFGVLSAVPSVLSVPLCTSSVCEDFLNDDGLKEALLCVLAKTRPVHAACFVQTPRSDRFVRWLQAEGFEVVGWDEKQAEISGRLGDKAYTEDHIFSKDPSLAALRPASRTTADAQGIPALLAQFHAEGIPRAVLKSGRGAGGSGVFFLDTAGGGTREGLERQLVAVGDNLPCMEPPFIVEELIESTVSPTVDLFIHPEGDVRLVGAACQRLADRRYYSGVHFSPAWAGKRWFKESAAAAETVGRGLARIGYRGSVNADFVLSKEGRPYLVEINARRSALCDALGAVTQAFGSPFACAFSAADYVKIPQDGCALPASSSGTLLIEDSASATPFRWTGLLVAKDGLTDTEEVIGRAIRSISGLGADDSLDRDFGDIGKVGELG